MLQIYQGGHCFASFIKTDQVRAVEEPVQELLLTVDVQGELLLVFTNIDPRAHDAEYTIGVQVEAGGKYKGEICYSLEVCLRKTWKVLAPALLPNNMFVDILLELARISVKRQCILEDSFFCSDSLQTTHTSNWWASPRAQSVRPLWRLCEGSQAAIQTGCVRLADIELGCMIFYAIVHCQCLVWRQFCQQTQITRGAHYGWGRPECFRNLAENGYNKCCSFRSCALVIQIRVPQKDFNRFLSILCHEAAITCLPKQRSVVVQDLGRSLVGLVWMLCHSSRRSLLLKATSAKLVFLFPPKALSSISSSNLQFAAASDW